MTQHGDTMEQTAVQLGEGRCETDGVPRVDIILNLNPSLV